MTTGPNCMSFPIYLAEYMSHPASASSAFVPATLFVFICPQQKCVHLAFSGTVRPSAPPLKKKTKHTRFWDFSASPFQLLSLVAAILAARRSSPCQRCLPACTQRCHRSVYRPCWQLTMLSAERGWGLGWGGSRQASSPIGAQRRASAAHQTPSQRTQTSSSITL